MHVSSFAFSSIFHMNNTNCISYLIFKKIYFYSDMIVRRRKNISTDLLFLLLLVYYKNKKIML